MHVISGLGVPDGAVRRDADRVRLAVGSARRLELLDLAALRIEMAEEPARIICVIDGVVLRNCNAPRARCFVGQRILGDLQRLRVDTADVRSVELVEEGHVFRVHHDAVGPRVGGRRRHELDRAVRGLGIKGADEIPRLNGEVHEPGAVECHRVRIARLWIGHLELGDFAGLRIDLPDERGGVARVPHVPGLVGDDAMRA